MAGWEGLASPPRHFSCCYDPHHEVLATDHHHEVYVSKDTSPQQVSAIAANRDQVTGICTRLRAEVESSYWRGKAGKTDWAIILTALDLAQYLGHLDLFLDARSMSFAAGVAPTTASHSLRRLVKSRWLIASPQNDIAPKYRIPKNRANEYTINPCFPHVYSYVLPRGTSQRPGERWLVSSGELESADLTTGEVFPNLIAILRDATHTYTHADTRRALLIGRTNVGVELGKSAVWLRLRADDEPRTIKELAGLAQVNPVTAGQVIRRKLAPKGLLVNQGGEWFALDEHPGGGWWEGGKWVQGIPLHECQAQDDRVGRRLRRIAADRAERTAELIRREEEWITAELEHAAREFELACT
jgi:hypothetical protein